VLIGEAESSAIVIKVLVDYAIRLWPSHPYKYIPNPQHGEGCKKHPTYEKAPDKKSRSAKKQYNTRIQYQPSPVKTIMGFTSRKSSTSSKSSSANSSTESLDRMIMDNTIPMGPREDNFNMDEKTRQQRMLAKCRIAREPWKSAKPLRRWMKTSAKEATRTA
jgi:hypothetical protein